MTQESPDYSAQSDNSKTRAAAIALEQCVIYVDFPKQGHRYLDFYLTFDAKPEVRNAILQCFVERYESWDLDAVAAIGNGGFTLGSGIASALNLPLVTVRKASDTVFDSYVSKVGMVYADRELTLSRRYDLGDKRVLLIDDTIATGGSFLGGLDLLRQAGALIIEIATVFETTSKGGRLAVAPIPVFSIIARDSF